MLAVRASLEQIEQHTDGSKPLHALMAHPVLFSVGRRI
jgi:hypothetical protein